MTVPTTICIEDALFGLPAEDPAELAQLRDQIIEATRARIGGPDLVETGKHGGGDALALCGGLDSLEAFEEYIRRLRADGWHQGSDESGEIRHSALHIVESVFETLRFWVMLMNVRRCPC